MLLIYFLFIFLNASLAMDTPATTEKECAAVDLSSRFGKNKDQGDSEFCYAFAASDVLSEALGIMPPRTVSPLHLSSYYISMSENEYKEALVQIQQHTIDLSGLVNTADGLSRADDLKKPLSPEEYNRFLNDAKTVVSPLNESMAYFYPTPPPGTPTMLREGGYPDLIISRAIREKQVCLEQEVPSMLFMQSFANGKFNDGYEQGFFRKRMAEMAGAEELRPHFDSIVKKYQKKHKSCTPLVAGTGPLPLEGFVSAIQDWAAARFRQQAQKQCKQPVPVKNLEVHTALNMGPNLKRTLQSNFDRKDPRPLLVTFNACLLQPCPAGTPRPHASVITGRKWKDGRCVLEIRNSWNKTCEPKQPDVGCFDGNWTVDLDRALPWIDRITWIEKTKSPRKR